MFAGHQPISAVFTTNSPRLSSSPLLFLRPTRRRVCPGNCSPQHAGCEGHTRVCAVPALYTLTSQGARQAHALHTAPLERPCKYCFYLHISSLVAMKGSRYENLRVILKRIIVSMVTGINALTRILLSV